MVSALGINDFLKHENDFMQNIKKTYHWTVNILIFNTAL